MWRGAARRGAKDDMQAVKLVRPELISLLGVLDPTSYVMRLL